MFRFPEDPSIKWRYNQCYQFRYFYGIYSCDILNLCLYERSTLIFLQQDFFSAPRTAEGCKREQMATWKNLLG